MSGKPLYYEWRERVQNDRPNADWGLYCIDGETRDGYEIRVEATKTPFDETIGEFPDCVYVFDEMHEADVEISIPGGTVSDDGYSVYAIAAAEHVPDDPDPYSLADDADTVDTPVEMDSGFADETDRGEPDSVSGLDPSEATRETLYDRCTIPGPAAEEQVESLLSRNVERCSVTWAKEMCDRFGLADGYETEFDRARAAIADVQDLVSRPETESVDSAADNDETSDDNALSCTNCAATLDLVDDLGDTELYQCPSCGGKGQIRTSGNRLGVVSE